MAGPPAGAGLNRDGVVVVLRDAGISGAPEGVAGVSAVLSTVSESS